MSAQAALPRSERRSPLVEIGLALCVCAIIYTTLQPWAGWRLPSHSIFRYLGNPWPKFWTWFDVTSNLIAYLPIGLLVAIRLRPYAKGYLVLLAAALAGFLLSFVLESLQNFVPTRVPSRLDLLINTVGALLGAAVALTFMQRPHDHRELLWHRPAIFGNESLPFLMLIGFWLAAQFSPQRMLYETGTFVSPVIQTLSNHVDRAFDPSLPSVQFAAGLLNFLQRLQVGDGYAVLVETASVSVWVACIGLLLIDSLASQRTRVLAVVGVLLLGFVIRSAALAARTGSLEFGLWLSAGAQAGLLLGPIVLLLMAGSRRRNRLMLALALVVIGLILSNVMPDNIYRQQMLTTGAAPGALRGLMNILGTVATVWPLLAVLLIARQLVRHDERWEGIPFMNESVLAGYRRLTKSARVLSGLKWGAQR